MTARSFIVLLIASALVALAVTFFLWQPPATVPPNGIDVVPGVQSPTTVATTVAKQAAAMAADVQPEVGDAQRTAVDVPVAPPLGPLAHLIGRCVDGDGRPLAGCNVDLHGWGANSQRTDAWLSEHGQEPPWQDPDALVTGVDGRFAFAFWPPPPFQFLVRIDKEGCGYLSGRWSKLDEGGTKDVGDVVVLPGVQLRGRVVDEQGNGQGKVFVSFNQPQPQQQRSRGFASEIQANWGEQTRTADDGTFQLRHCLVPGTYEVSLMDLLLASAKTVELTNERPHEFLTVVVGTAPEGASISGRILDETGAPAARVEISAFSGGYTSTRSKEDGTFTLVARDQLTEKVTRLNIQSDNYESPAAQLEVAWGSSDLEIRVARRGELLLRVTDQQRQAVTHYSVRMLPIDTNRWSSNDSRVRTRGEHQDGMVTLSGLPQGKCLIFVEFPATSGLEMLTTQLDNSTGGSRRLDLIAQPTATRMLRLLDTDGTPIADAQVRLCELFDKPFDAARTVSHREHWWSNARNWYAMIVFTGSTQADGTLQLRGPGDRELGLLLGGKGNVTPLREVTRLDVREELVLRCDRGATLKGRCVPAAGLAALHRLAGIAPDAAFANRMEPSLVLSRADGAKFPNSKPGDVASSPLVLADDGTFAASGIPAGTWKVSVSCAVTLGDSSSYSHREIYLADVSLTSGETTDLTLDLSKVVPGMLVAHATLNGVPLLDTYVTYTDALVGGVAKTDQQGKLTLSLLGGSYELGINQPYLKFPNKVAVRSNETTTLELQFFAGKVRLHVLDPEGKPAAAVSVMVGSPARPIGTTDANGALATQLATGNHIFTVLPQRLTSREEQMRLWSDARASGSNDAFAPHLLTIGEISLQANDDRELELRLPPTWGN